MTTIQQMSLFIVVSVAFTESVVGLTVAENFKKRERISIS
jgi:NADH:ubiquinone oxidoreductase subunit K